MQYRGNIIRLLTRLWRHIGPTRYQHLLFLMGLIIITSFAEVISMGAVIPFLGVLASPERVFNYVAVKPIIQFLGLVQPSELLLPFTIVFVLAILISGIMRLLLLRVNTNLSYGIGADLGISIYQRTLYQSYEVHCSRNSSEIIDSISNKISAVISIINMLLILVSAIIILSMTILTLLLIQPIFTLFSIGGFGLIYFLIAYFNKKKLLHNSELIAHESNNLIKSMQEGLGGIRDVIIDGSQAIYCQIFRNADSSFRRAQGSNLFIVSSPRYFMETFGMILIAVIAFFLSQHAIANTIPILGALALGAQRLLPLLQQIYSSWTGILGQQASLQEALKLLDQPLPGYLNEPSLIPLPFKSEIRLRNIKFRYTPHTPYILKNINLEILKGDHIGFIGMTGSGKSTLLDIIMGLLEPSAGRLEVDGRLITIANKRAWQSHIAHVPQNIFLSDNTIEENIAFGVPKNLIDFERVKKAARGANIADSIETWTNQYKTLVGERGIRLSGGQRQRIGIARALYKKADVIIFDEATSALDSKTEQSVMRVIDNFNKNTTLLIIAHRLTSLKGCNKIVELNNDGNIKRVGSYLDIIK